MPLFFRGGSIFTCFFKSTRNFGTLRGSLPCINDNQDKIQAVNIENTYILYILIHGILEALRIQIINSSLIAQTTFWQLHCTHRSKSFQPQAHKHCLFSAMHKNIWSCSYWCFFPCTKAFRRLKYIRGIKHKAHMFSWATGCHDHIYTNLIRTPPTTYQWLRLGHCTSAPNPHKTEKITKKNL
jgi:hypothetical protein